MERIAARIASVSGWRRYGLAFVLGGVATLTLPPANLFPLAFLIFPPLVWLVGASDRPRAAFAVGWWFGFGFFVFGLYWIGNALLVFAAQFAWLLPFACAGLPGAMALYTGVATLVAWFGRNHLQRALLLGVAWVVFEWVRGHALTGFPWNLLGYAWTGSDTMMQAAALVGVYGLSLGVIVSACLPAALGESRKPWPILLITAGLPLAVWAGGSIRLHMAPEQEYVDGVGLRIVQSDIPQKEKWAREYQERNIRQFLELSTANRPDWITHVVWPETAATFYVATNPAIRGVLATVVPKDGLLLTGAPRRDSNTGNLTNAMVAIDDAGQVAGWHDKFHLVPFGEYVPFAKYLPLDKITHGKSGFTPGPGIRTLSLRGLPPVSVLICYEVIFPGAVASRSARPAWLLNLTNDAWYGLSAGPYQHLAQARVRAVEEGLPLIRAAYTGISAVIDPYGRILRTRGLNRAGTIDTRIPKRIQSPPLYADWGDLPVLAIIFLICAIILLSTRNIIQPKEQ